MCTGLSPAFVHFYNLVWREKDEFELQIRLAVFLKEADAVPIPTHEVHEDTMR